MEDEQGQRVRGRFLSRQLAIEAAEGYRAEISENGGVTTIIVRQSDGSEQSIQP